MGEQTTPESPTGDPVLDQLLRTKLPECCDLVFAVLADRHPELEPERAQKTAAIVVSQLLNPMMQLFTFGFLERSKTFTDQGEPK